MDDDNALAAQAKKGSPFLNTDQAAFYVGLSRRTLEKMRREHRGPPFRKHGRYVRYHIAELIEWSKANGRNTPNQPGGEGSSDA
jgi:predicted DNA-binding transcriptional regulator AlpA